MEVHHSSVLDAAIQRLQQRPMGRTEEPATMARIEDRAVAAQEAPSVDGGHDPTDMGVEAVCTRTGGYFSRNYKCTRIWNKGGCKGNKDGGVSCSPPDVQDFAGVCKLIKGNVFCSRIAHHCETHDGRTKCGPPTTQQWVYKCGTGTCRLIPLVEAAAHGFQVNIGTNDQAEKAVQGVLSKRADGYCTEGTICGSPVYGRPLWIWFLAVFVILLGLKAIDDS